MYTRCVYTVKCTHYVSILSSVKCTHYVSILSSVKCTHDVSILHNTILQCTCVYEILLLDVTYVILILQSEENKEY